MRSCLQRGELRLRWDVFNVANHTHFFNIDGNITDGSNFGIAKKVADPRLTELYFGT